MARAKQKRALASLWMGPALSYLEVVCLKSMLAQGHRVVLYSYQDVANVPEGVEQCDARDIFDPGCIYVHERTNTPAIHADFFRLEMLRKTDHIWVDTDVYLVKPIPLHLPYIFAWEKNGSIGNSVLALPKASRALDVLNTVIDEAMATVERIEMPDVPHAFGTGYGAVALKMFIATMGPVALTAALNETMEIHYALPKATFYPIDIGKVQLFVKRPAVVKEKITADVIGVHMWSWRLDNALARRDEAHIEKSYIGHICRAHGVDRTETPLTLAADTMAAQ